MPYGKIDITADEEDLQTLLSKQAVYEIPEYQRSYSWGRQQWKELLNDLREGLKHDRLHSLGEIKLVPDDDADPRRFEIVDGQQRITTMCVLITALRDEYERRGGNGVTVGQLERLIQTRDMDGLLMKNLELLSVGDDREAYETVHDAHGAEIDMEHNVVGCYDFFTNVFSSLGSDRLDDLRKYILAGLSFITTKIDDPDQAFIIFETQNRGLDLEELERAKAVVMRAAHRRADDELRDIQHLWSKMVEVCEKIRPKSRAQPIKNICSVDPDIDVAALGRSRNAPQVVAALKAAIGGFDGPVKEFLRWLSMELEQYHRITSGQINEYRPKQNRRINSFAKQAVSGNTYANVVLYIESKRLEEPADLMRAFEAFSKLALRLNLAQVTATKKRDAWHDVRRALSESRPASYAVASAIREHTPNDESLKLQLHDASFPQNKSLLYILYKAESEHFRGAATSDAAVPLPGEDVEIEHIAPQGSFNYKKYSSWESVLNHNEDRFENVRNTLGNVTLLRGAQNQAAGDEPYADKCAKYRSSDFGMSRELAGGFDDWGFEQIEDRTEKIASIVVDAVSPKTL